jgi:hypothetical protein
MLYFTECIVNCKVKCNKTGTNYFEKKHCMMYITIFNKAKIKLW